MKRWHILYTILLSFSIKTLGMGIQFPADYHNITTFEGLPSNTVGAIKKDSLGFLWIGTKLGLCRFDGCEIKTYPTLSEDDIWSIEELDSDTLVIGTVNSLKYFSRKTHAVIPVDIPSTIVKSLKKIDKHSFLAGTEDGLYLINHNTPRQILLETGLSPCNHVTSIIQEDKNIYWFSTADGLGRIDIRTMTPVIYRIENKTSNSNYFICLTRIANQIYLGSFNKGIFRFDMSEKKFTKVNGFEHNLIMTIDGHEDQLFVGTNGQGLKIMSLTDGNIEVISHKAKARNTINSNTITAFLYTDDIQWVGTQFGGISYTPRIGAKFSYYSKNNFYSTDYRVRSCYIFPNGNKLIGTRTGLFYISEKNDIVRKYSIEDRSSSLRSDIVLYINRIYDKILVATYGGGIHIFDEATLTLKNLSQEEPFLYGCFFHMTPDTDGNLWFASQSGLYQSTSDGHILKNYDTMNSILPTNAIFYLCIDSMKRLWIGTKFGLYLMDISTGKLSTDCFGSLIKSEVKYIMEDSQKYMWICTDNGLYKIGADLTIAEHFTTNDLLPDNQVFSILEDGHGIYWIATRKEIVRYNPTEKVHYTYQQLDGLNNQDFNNHVIISNDSIIWWPNEGGLIYTPEKNIDVDREFTGIPTITSYYIADIEYDFSYMDEPRQLTLSHSENNIRFKFSNMDYSLPYANLYEYKLEAYDTDWIQQTGINEVSYKDLPSGHYTFKLRTPGGEKLQQQVSIHVRKSYTFITGLFIFILITGLLITYFCARIWKLKKRMNAERTILNTIQEQGKVKKIQFPDSKANNLLNNLLLYMHEEKPYLNAKLTIVDVSVKLECTELELSQLLNNHMQVNFANFINVYRVNEIKSRLNKENLSKYTLKALSEQCGFNSKTTFYRVFKNVTEMTPLEYCKKIGLTVDENQ